MTAIDEAVDRIVQVLESANGGQTAREVLDVLVKDGVQDEVASRAIASGARRGAFQIDSHLRVSLPVNARQPVS